MTTDLAIIVALSTLLIAGLLIYLRGKFEQLAKDEESVDMFKRLFDYAANMDQVGQPKRRKYRDNK